MTKQRVGFGLIGEQIVPPFQGFGSLNALFLS